MKKIVCFLFGLILIFLITTGFLATQPLYEINGQLSLVLLGEKEIFLEYGETFQESGAEAVYTDAFDKTTVTVPVEIHGQVNTDKVGDYTISYSATFNNSSSSTDRTVHVIDTVSPTISLVINPETYTLPGHSYQEEGFSATDNYDGDITNRVECKEKDGIVTYTVSDSSGNTATVTRTIRYFDPEPPKLQLLGNSTIVLTAGQE